MEILLLGISFFILLYLITYVSDKLQAKNKKGDTKGH